MSLEWAALNDSKLLFNKTVYIHVSFKRQDCRLRGHYNAQVMVDN